MSGRFDIVAFDLDGVLVTPESSWVYVHHHFGVSNEVSLKAYLRGEIDDNEFMRRDVALWKKVRPNVKADDINAILDCIAVTEGVKETVAALKAAGIQTAIVSGGLKHLATRVAEMSGIDHVMANGLETDAKGNLAGRGILEVELNKKGLALTRLLRKLRIDPERCAAVGNSFIDVQMFEVSGCGIAFMPVDEEARKGADFVVSKPDLREILPHIIGR